MTLTGWLRSLAFTVACIPSMVRKPSPSSEFVDELCHDYSAVLTAEGRRNQGMVDDAEILLPAATAIPLSLIATEFVTNA